MNLPRVQIQSCVRQGSWWLPKFLEQLDSIDYPKDHIRYAFVEGGSTDASREILLDWLKDKKDVLYRQIDMTPGLQLRQRMWFSGNQARRLLQRELPGAEPVDYLFICDCDVIKIPENILRELIALDVDIVAPYVYVDPQDHPGNPYRNKEVFFDTWAFRFLHGPHPGFTFNSAIIHLYARNMERDPTIQADLEKGLIPMQSVGACPVLIKAEVVKAVDYWGNEAIVGFCNEAREKGYKIWSYPAMRCLHRWR